MPAEKGRFQGCLLGLACGDAVGTTVEFKRRGTFPPVTDMVGGGKFSLKPGEWTDDTSMALCLATSLVEKAGFDPRDQMTRYCRWADEGYLSSTGRCFDIGNTTSSALRRYKQTGDPYSGSVAPNTAGNGSIMRLAPVPMFYHPDLDAAIHFSGESSRTTHGTEQCVDACRLFGAMISMALSGASKEDILFRHPFARGEEGRALCGGIKDIALGHYTDKAEVDILGSGYVVRSLEAALWCFWHMSDFEGAVLRAVNLGVDADTTGAVCGQIAGAHYGVDGIPDSWLNRLVLRTEICEISDMLNTGRASL